MFVVSMRVNRKKSWLAAGLALCAVLVVIAAVKGFFVVQQTWAENKINEQKVAGKTEQQRQDFLASFGWECLAEPDEVVEIKIPETFDKVYEQYNNIQKQQNMDLSKYQGKRCKKYIYTITNYPGRPNGVSCTLLVYQGKVIGGDITGTGENAFTHGFALPA